jgi:hypothetical protein
LAHPIASKSTFLQVDWLGALKSAPGQKAKYSLRVHVFRCSPNNRQWSGHAEGVPLHFEIPACVTVGAIGLVDPSTSDFEFTVGTEGELLSDRVGQNSLALADLGDVVAPSRRNVIMLPIQPIAPQLAATRFGPQRLVGPVDIRRRSVRHHRLHAAGGIVEPESARRRHLVVHSVTSSASTFAGAVRTFQELPLLCRYIPERTPSFLDENVDPIVLYGFACSLCPSG